MRRFVTQYMMAALVAFTLAACNDVVLNERMQGTGYLNVCLQKDESVLSKAIVAPSDDMTFRIDIYSGQTLKVSIEDHRSVTQDNPVTLPVGSYRVIASCGDNSKAGFDNPCYSGETEVLIKADQTEEAEIVCTLSNVMVTVELADRITDNFTDCSVVIDDGQGNSLTFSQDADNMDAVAYIPVSGILNVKLSMFNEAGRQAIIERQFLDVKAREHYSFTFELMESAGETGYGAIRLVVDDTMVEQTYELELDFSDSEEPEYVTTDPEFDPTGDLTYIVGDDSPKVLNFSAPEGIESFTVAIDNNVVTRSSAPLAVYELVEATDDVINTLAAIGIRTSSIRKGATTATIDMTDYVKSLLTGEYNLNIALYDAKYHVSRCDLDFTVIADVDADIVSVTPWAEFVIVSAKYFSVTPPEGLTFMYRKSTESAWTTYPAGSVTIDGAARIYEAEIGGLEGAATYVIKAVSAADTDTREVEFTTETAEVLYNMSFDDWYQDGKVWYPYAKNHDPSVWDSANKGAATFIGSSTSPVEGADAVSGKAVRMESKYAVIAFAAGNLYTGKFGKIDGVGAQLEWGVPFTSRPVALRGYYKYTPVNINRTGDGMGSYKGQVDKAQIQVALADWSAPFNINTKSGQFVDFNADYIIAYGKLESSDAYSDYKDFVIPIEYRSTTRKPAYIVVSACASYLGDYFTGGEGSVLHVDEFSFEYDVTELTEEQRTKVNYR